MNLLFLFFLEGDPAQKAVLTRTLKIKGAYITVSPRSQPGINTVTRQKQKATQNFSRVVRSPLPENQSSASQDKLPPKSAAFCSFVSLQGKTLFIRQIKVAKTAKAKLCVTKHGIGGPGTLWHIKIRYLPNAVSQSLRIPLWHPKSPSLLKPSSQSPRIQLTLNSVSQSPRIQLTLNSVIRMPVSKARTGVQSQNSASPNSGAFAHGCS